MNKKVIKRVVLGELKRYLDKKELMLLVGARQVGKTTLLKMLHDDLIVRGKKTLFLNLDVEEDKKYFVSQSALLKKFELEFGKEKGYVFIDEIQRKQDAGVFLKGIYDLDLPHKLIVSGSGSLELKEKIHESLAGRKIIFEITPISFPEFINFKTDYRYEKKLNDYFDVEKSQVATLTEEYLNFGGYPRLILEDTVAEKRRIIDEIFNSYLERDISLWLGVEKTDAFTSLVKIMAAQTGSLTNHAELANTIGIAQQTVKIFLNYLEKTFILQKVAPFTRNKRKEITKSPIFYFTDVGLKNNAAGSFGRAQSAIEMGHGFENFVFNIIKEKLRWESATVHFWRTKSGSEVDFLIDLGKELLPIETKFQEMKAPKIERPLRNFIEQYQPSRALVVNKNLSDKVLIGKTEIVFLPYWELLNYRLLS